MLQMGESYEKVSPVLEIQTICDINVRLLEECTESIWRFAIGSYANIGNADSRKV